MTLVPTPSVEVASSGRRIRVSGGDVEQAGEPADAADDLGPRGPLDGRPHQVDGALARLDVDPGAA